MKQSYNQTIKRILDVLLAALAIAVLWPVLLVVCILSCFVIGRPTIFRQQRPGLHGRPFTLYKFRTMRDAYDRDGKPLSDDQRMTRYGSFLRETSLDELPELINVLKGDMSLIGPRPLLMKYLDLYTPHQMRRHEVRPGITGWAQVNGRNALSWEDRFDLDVWYVDHCNLQLDAKIVGLTIWKVLRREGISHAGEATMSEFMGTH